MLMFGSYQLVILSSFFFLVVILYLLNYVVAYGMLLMMIEYSFWIRCTCFHCRSSDAAHTHHGPWGLQGKRNSSEPLLHRHPLHRICGKQGCGAYPRGCSIHQQAQWFWGKVAARDHSLFLPKWCAVQACWAVQQRDARVWVQKCPPGTRNANSLILLHFFLWRFYILFQGRTRSIESYSSTMEMKLEMLFCSLGEYLSFIRTLCPLCAQSSYTFFFIFFNFIV